MVKSFLDYWSQIKSMTPEASDTILFFRGQSDAGYEQMLPGICRGSNVNEQYEYRQIQIDYPEEFDKHSHLSNLVKMQHYGCNTRLLDFTLNPLVALYFACEFNPEKHGKVFVIRVKKEEILFQNSDRALMLSCLPAFSKTEKQSIKGFCENHPGRITDQDIAFSTEMQRFLHEVRGEYPAFETAIIGEDLLKYYFIRPHKDNERMKIQDGVFAIFGLNENALVQDINQRAEKIEIDASAKKDILKDLDLLRINDSVLYPGLERRAMQNRGKIAVWTDVK